MHPVLVRTLTIHTGSRPLAEDLAQETLARVWQKWSHVSSYELPDRFALRCAFNLASSGFRRRAAERRAQIRSGAASSIAPVDSATELAVRQAVQSLPPRQRSVITCRYFLGLSVLETADAVGIAEGTVKSLTHKATGRLRELLTESPTSSFPPVPSLPRRLVTLPELPELLSGLAGPNPTALDLDAIADRSRRTTQRRRLATSLTAGALCVAAIVAFIVVTRPASTSVPVEPQAPTPEFGTQTVVPVDQLVLEPLTLDVGCCGSVASRRDGTLLSYDPQAGAMTVFESPTRTFRVDTEANLDASELLSIGPDDVAYIQPSLASDAARTLAVSTNPDNAGEVVNTSMQVGNSTDGSYVPTRSGLVHVACCTADVRQPSDDPNAVVYQWHDHNGDVLTDSGPELWVNRRDGPSLQVVRRDGDDQLTWEIPDAGTFRGMPPLVPLTDGGVLMRVFANTNPYTVMMLVSDQERTVLTATLPWQPALLERSGTIIVQSDQGFARVRPFRSSPSSAPNAPLISTPSPAVVAADIGPTSGDDILLAAAEAIVGQPEVGYRRWAIWDTSVDDEIGYPSEAQVISVDYATGTEQRTGASTGSVIAPGVAGDAEAIARLQAALATGPPSTMTGDPPPSLPDTDDPAVVLAALNGTEDLAPQRGGLQVLDSVFLNHSTSRRTQAAFYRALAAGTEMTYVGLTRDRFARSGHHLRAAIAANDPGSDPFDVEVHLMIDPSTGQALAGWVIVLGTESTNLSGGTPIADPYVVEYWAILDEGPSQPEACRLACFAESASTVTPDGSELEIEALGRSLTCSETTGRCFPPIVLRDGTLVSIEPDQGTITVYEPTPRTFRIQATIDPAITYLVAAGPDGVVYVVTQSAEITDPVGDLLAVSTTPSSAGEVVFRAKGAVGMSGDSTLKPTAAGLVPAGCCGGEPRQPSDDPSRVVMQWRDHTGEIVVDYGPELWVNYASDGPMEVVRRDGSTNNGGVFRSTATRAICRTWLRSPAAGC